MDLFLSPLEAVFFGPPRSNVAGETHEVRSLFPPPISAFQGMVRSRLLAGASPALDLSDRSRQARQRVAELVGEPGALPEGWQLTGPFPAELKHETTERRRPYLEPWLPCPEFLRRPEPNVGEPVRWEPLEPAEDQSWMGFGAEQATAVKDEPFHLFTTWSRQQEPSLGGWLRADNLLWALSGKGTWAREGHGRVPPFVKWEEHTGLAIDPEKGVAMDGMLYCRHYLRWAFGSGLYGTLTAPSLPSALDLAALGSGTIAMGRGGRLGAFEPVPRMSDAWNQLRSGAHLPEELPEHSRCWLVLLTPARVPRECQLDLRGSWGVAIDEPKVELRVLRAGLARPEVLGGFSLARGASSANQTYLGAGSCWLVELTGGTPQQRADVLKRLNGRCVLGANSERPFGHGFCLVGTSSPLR